MPALTELGRQLGEGVTPEHHAKVKEAIIAGLQEVPMGELDTATQRAWSLAYDEVVARMTAEACDVRVWVQAA
ncbi:MAG: hypothetical protein AAF637_16550 [Pseudomonadota bacterium]